jgi:hypothetical protein
MHGSIMNNKLILHIDEFCDHILQGVEKWIANLNHEQNERLKSFLMLKNICSYLNTF